MLGILIAGVVDGAVTPIAMLVFRTKFVVDLLEVSECKVN
jgi:hypothetical protein